MIISVYKFNIPLLTRQRNIYFYIFFIKYLKSLFEFYLDCNLFEIDILIKIRLG